MDSGHKAIVQKHEAEYASVDLRAHRGLVDETYNFMSYIALHSFFAACLVAYLIFVKSLISAYQCTASLGSELVFVLV